MASFPNEGIRPVSRFLEFHANGNQVPNAVASLGDDRPHDLLITSTIARTKGVVDVSLHALMIGFVKDSSDASLRPIGAGILWPLLGHHRNMVPGVC